MAKKTAALPPASAVVVAAGSSTRMGGKVRKPYLKLRGRPILAWTLAALAKVPELREIILVTRPEDRRRALAAAKLARLPRHIHLGTADGGARRQDSVLNGLQATRADAELVLIHDAARPFPPLSAMGAACAAARSGGAAILAVPVRDTLKRQQAQGGAGEGVVAIETTVPRAGLWQAQTPQIFQRGLLLNLFARLASEAPTREVTDDASVCEIFGQSVALVDSSETNLKVTRPEDLPIAEALLKAGVVGGKGR